MSFPIAIQPSRLPFVVLGALVLGVTLGVVTVSLLGVTGVISYEVPEAVVAEMPEGGLDASGTPRTPEPLHGVDQHSPGPPAVPTSPRQVSAPRLEAHRDLVERSPFGTLPRLSPRGIAPMAAYAAHVPASDLPQVSIVLTDLGLDPELAEKSVSLPIGVGLALTPYISTTAEWQRFMRWHGHETLLMMPLEAVDTFLDDQGSLALGVDMAEGDLLVGLYRILGRGAGYVGVAGKAGSFASSPDRFGPLARDIAARGIGFIELGGTHLREVAAAAGLSYLSASVELDSRDALRPELIDRTLGDLERLALANGSAVAFTGPVPLVLDRLWTWAQGIEARGVTLVPPTTLLTRPRPPG